MALKSTIKGNSPKSVRPTHVLFLEAYHRKFSIKFPYVLQYQR